MDRLVSTDERSYAVYTSEGWGVPLIWKDRHGCPVVLKMCPGRLWQGHQPAKRKRRRNLGQRTAILKCWRWACASEDAKNTTHLALFSLHLHAYETMSLHSHWVVSFQWYSPYPRHRPHSTTRQGRRCPPPRSVSDPEDRVCPWPRESCVDATPCDIYRSIRNGWNGRHEIRCARFCASCKEPKIRSQTEEEKEKREKNQTNRIASVMSIHGD